MTTTSGARCLLVHGHFYQPPRENPWTGGIDPQHSAWPWENWNHRIAEECYLPMARSRVYGADGAVAGLHNNYANTSFNFGPTLLSWLADRHPRLIASLREATAVATAFAVAQAYSHMMLPLADVRDRHTQVLWGLGEFRRRFGFYPDGMWLSECGLDMDTARALMDHGVKYVILSPHQASKARPFGDSEWREASMGSVDTRRAYRLFETDGGGRTHFNRFLDVVFYTPGLNLKVSFDHILNRPDDLARELESCYLPEYDGAQLVSIVTDGEIYGHHEKRGEEALARLFLDIAPSLGLRVCSAGDFVRDNPPTWEVRLWEGEDGKGSSWSCQHGVGRWHRDCGCTPSSGSGWNQAWRGPLRDAFDLVRDRVAAVARRELGKLVWDADVARDDYIAVVLDPSAASRRAFLARHAQRDLNLHELETLWRVLEARHNAMLMYTSCGWFFDELSGLEPVQNMRYALRAAELVRPYEHEDIARLLEDALAEAKSNIPSYGDGREVFRKLVLPTRHDNREIAAAMALCLAAELPADSLAWELRAASEPRERSLGDDGRLAWGSFVCRNPRLDRFIRASWSVRLGGPGDMAVVLGDYEEAQGDPARADGETPFGLFDDHGPMEERFGDGGIAPERLPAAVKAILYRVGAGDEETALENAQLELGRRALPFAARARRHDALVPDAIVRTVRTAFEREMELAVLGAITRMTFDAAPLDAVTRVRASAGELGVGLDQDAPVRHIRHAAMELLHWLRRIPEDGWLDRQAVRTLADGAAWLAPSARYNGGLSYPGASELAAALGRGLAALRERLLSEPDRLAAALRLLPVPELLAFARRAGLSGVAVPMLGMEYWDFLDTPLARLDDRRVREIGVELGFAAEAVDARIKP